MAKYWFRPKKYGYGAYPDSWEGWIIIAVFVAIIIVLAPTKKEDLVKFVTWILLLSVILIFVSYKKTKGKWKWRWGEK